MIKSTQLESIKQVGTQIVEYQWIQHQEEILIPQQISNQWKQYIVDHFEMFLIIMVLIYCVTFYFMYKAFSKKTQRAISNMRKESQTSDELQSSIQLSNRHIEVIKRDRSSSTESSPCNKKSQEGAIIPINKEKQYSFQNESEFKELKLNSPQISEIRKEQRIEVERDEKNNTIIKTETQKVVQKFVATHEQFQQYKKEQFKSDAQECTGINMIEYQYADGQIKQTVQVLNHWSSQCENGRFEKLYQQPIIIGKGAFGDVFKCKKTFDSKEYAVKRVYFKVKNEKSIRDLPIFREIQNLQEISHHNIVRYFNSWIQELDVSQVHEISSLHQLVKEHQLHQQQQQHQLAQNQSIQSSYRNQFIDDLSSLDGIVQFVGESNKTQQLQTNKQSKQITKTYDSFHISDYSSEIQSKMRKYHFNPNSDEKFSLYSLYIEMELCEQTLKEFIEKVDRKTQKELIIQYFQQIMEGVVFMHEKNIMHRDLKPQNIFITKKKVVKIGDLGLSNGANVNEYFEDQSFQVSEDYTNNVGTPMYMSPEVKDGHYGLPADIYSLGVIFFEMLWKMKTFYERNRLIKAFTEEQILPPDLIKEHPKESGLMLKMVNKNPNKRPTALQILSTLKQ